MSILELQKAVTELPVAEVWSLAEWIEEYKADLWDKQREADSNAGKLNHLIDEACAEFKAGITRPI